tara:strand:+ start:94190 stop:94525 length:336 start_codon:yes stop_codon:yes gene_type:complete
MDSILYFLFWAAFIFVIMRFGFGSHIMGHSDGTAAGAGQSSEKLRWTPPKTDVDPICQKVIHTNNAKPSVHDGNIYYFCSRECREIFEAAPDLYVGPESERPRTQQEESNV